VNTVLCRLKSSYFLDRSAIQCKDIKVYLVLKSLGVILFLIFPACFYIPIIFSNFNFSNLLHLRNLQE
jgi:hypothetical protein